jgi:ADP-ribose pyrophosphatase YjhB (NUDIX family)
MSTPQRRPEICVGAVAVRDDELLLIRRGTPPGAGYWSLPGGRVEVGESLAAALVRELEEETGLAALVGPLLGWVERIGAGHHFVILDFEVTVLDGEARAGDDAAEVAWVPLEEVTGLPLVDGLAEFLADHDIIPTIV